MLLAAIVAQLQKTQYKQHEQNLRKDLSKLVDSYTDITDRVGATIVSSLNMRAFTHEHKVFPIDLKLFEGVM